MSAIPTKTSGGGGRLLSNNRNRLLLLLLVSTLGIGALAWRAASGDISYYVEPNEFLAQVKEGDTSRWRVGGRVVAGSIAEENGRPVAWTIEGTDGSRIDITYDGIVPNMFSEGAFVVVEGSLEPGGKTLTASSVIIKHENEFYSDPPPPDSPSANLVPNGE